MKKTNKLLVLFVVLSLLISMVSVSAFAGTAPAETTMIVDVTNYRVDKGEKNQHYKFDLGVAYDQVAVGTIKVVGGKGAISNIRLLDTVAGSKVTYSYDALANGEATFVVYNPSVNAQAGASQGLEIWVDVTNSAAVGSTCSIIITYDIYGAESDEPINLVKCEARLNLTIVKPVIDIDYTELDKQLERAKAYEGMSKFYPAEAYGNFEAALKEAKAVRTLRNQDRVDAAAIALKEAIDALGDPFNYSALEAIIEAVKNSSVDFKTEGLKAAWNAFMVALENGKAVLTNGAGSQAEIDAATKAISDTFTALMNAIKALEDATTGTTIVEKPGETVTVPVPGETVEIPGETVEVPGEPQIVKESKLIWLILFIIFAIISLILAILLIVSLVKKNKNANNTDGIGGSEIGEDGAMEGEDAAEETEAEETSEE
jgi:hypothetical protein